jgi:hypothetical protein
MHSTPSERGDAIAVANAAGTGLGAATAEGNGHLGAAGHGR